MSILNKIKKSLWKLNIDLDRFSSTKNYLYRRQKILDYYNIDTVLDVGANIGQYAVELRELNYRNKIISFEPMQNEFKILENKTISDNKWEAFNYALGSKNDKEKINISHNSFSSSILNILPTHIDNAPESKFKESEDIQVKKLDSVFNDLVSNNSKSYLKIDTQGYEKEVLIGAFDSLKKIDCIQIEMSLTPLYSNDASFDELFKLLNSKDFKLVGFESGFTNTKTGELLQLDGIFVRK